MKKMKRTVCLLLAAVLSLGLLGGCTGGNTPNQTQPQEDQTQPTQPTQPASTDAGYRVTVTDALGAPWTTGVIVRFMQGGEQVAMQVVDENGTVEKTLPRGNYTVELMFTGDAADFHYDQTGLELTEEKTELTVVLTGTLTAGPTTLYVGSGSYEAYPVGVGGTYVSLVPGQRNYFLFTPTVAGAYAISADGDTQIGYYGAPHFVQELNAAEVVDNCFTMNVKTSMIGTGDTGTTVVVIGIDAGADTDSCVLTIERTGEPAWTVEDEPWRTYAPTVALAPYTLPAGLTIGEFDLTAATDSYELVLGDDGFYHLGSADGALVLVRLGEKNQYLDCFQVILEHSGVTKYFYNADGSFDRKESYSECLLQYIENMDQDTGLYPLTEDLKYIIQQRGDYSGWWDESSSLYLFVDAAGNRVPDINPEIAWLFMCCYAQ